MMSLLLKHGVIKTFVALVLLLNFAAGCSGAKKTSLNGRPKAELILATTTSTYDTGLLDVLIPVFTKEYGYRVKALAVGTGEALALGKRGEADVLLVHAPDAEKAFMAAGHGVTREQVMYNWFLLVGPSEDIAGTRKMDAAAAAFKAIAEKRAPFVSRGDNSGTHRKELTLWKESGLRPRPPWYQEAGQGMGATLRIADERRAYTLTDEATFRTQQNILALRAVSLTDERLKNVYSVIVVDGGRARADQRRGAAAFSSFLTGKIGQSLIGRFKSPDYSGDLFIPNAR